MHCFYLHFTTCHHFLWTGVVKGGRTVDGSQNVPSSHDANDILSRSELNCHILWGFFFSAFLWWSGWNDRCQRKIPTILKDIFFREVSPHTSFFEDQTHIHHCLSHLKNPVMSSLHNHLVYRFFKWNSRDALNTVNKLLRLWFTQKLYIFIFNPGSFQANVYLTTFHHLQMLQSLQSDPCNHHGQQTELNWLVWTVRVLQSCFIHQ